MLIELEQGSNEWLSWRRQHIGASDAGVILGCDPYKTPYQLWQEKLGMFTPEVTSAMQYGKDNEEKARQYFNHEMNVNVIPRVMVHPMISYMAASLDGLSECRKVLLEIKCNGSKNHQIAKEQGLPPHHYAQVQHQMEVIGVNKCYYLSYVETDPVIIEVLKDYRFISKMLISQHEFWKCIEEFTPPTMSNKDYMHISNPSFSDIAEEWRKTNQELRRLQEKERELKDTLINMCNGNSSIGGGVKLSKRVRKGSIDYSIIKELENVNLECYRKQNTEYWVIGEA